MGKKPKKAVKIIGMEKTPSQAEAETTLKA